VFCNKCEANGQHKNHTFLLSDEAIMAIVKRMAESREEEKKMLDDIDSMFAAW